VTSARLQSAGLPLHGLYVWSCSIVFCSVFLWFCNGGQSIGPRPVRLCVVCVCEERERTVREEEIVQRNTEREREK